MRPALPVLTCLALLATSLAAARASAEGPDKPTPIAAKAGKTAGKEKAPEPPPLPPAEARLRVIVPQTSGAWIMRIDNEGNVPLRIPADVRLLKLEIEPEEGSKEKPTTCELPKALRPTGFPEARALLLGPGQSYLEPFDPTLFCFGKAAAKLKGNALIHARFGWDPPKKPSKKGPQPPFAVETTEREPTISPLVDIKAPSIVLGPDQKEIVAAMVAAVITNPEVKPEDKGEAKAPKPIVDERAGKLEITATNWIESSEARGMTLTVTAKNTGLRPLIVALRPWMLSFHIEGPYGISRDCDGSSARGSLPRDAFQTMKPGASTSFSVLLAEVCPRESFPRPGLYRVTTTLSANETTSGVDAYTADIGTNEPSFLRLVNAEGGFYLDPPKALPAPPPADDEKEKE